MRAALSPPEPTYADLEALPEHVRGEIIDRELLMSPRPAPRHIRSATKLASFLSRAFDDGLDGPGGWWILSEPELRLRGECLIPDIAGWRLGTLPELPETSAFEVAPDWVCEVISPSTERLDRGRKLAAYARHRVTHVWLLNPVSRTVEILRRSADVWVLVKVHDNDDALVAEPFEAVPLEVHRLWHPPAEPDAPAAEPDSQ